MRRYSTPGLTNHSAASSSIVLTDAAALQNGAAAFGDTLEASMFVFHDPAKSQWPASCSTMRANSPQHEYENRAILFMRRRKASRNALILHAISELSHLSTVSLTPNQLLFLFASDVTPINHPPPGMACWHEAGKVGLLACLDVWHVIMVVVVIKKRNSFIAGL